MDIMAITESLPEVFIGGGIGTAAGTAILMKINSLRKATERLYTLQDTNRSCLDKIREIIARELHPNGGPPLAERVAKIEARLDRLER